MATLREAGTADLDRIMELEDLCFGAEAFNRRQYRRLLQSPRCRILLQEEGRDLAGMLVVTWRLDSSILRIYSIAVTPRSQGRGLAKILMNEAIDLGLRLGRKWVVLEVNARNDAAIGLYHKYGFQEVVTIPDYYGEGKHALRMALKL